MLTNGHSGFYSDTLQVWGIAGIGESWGLGRCTPNGVQGQIAHGQGVWGQATISGNLFVA